MHDCRRVIKVYIYILGSIDSTLKKCMAKRGVFSVRL